MLHATTSLNDHEELRKLDVLGLEDNLTKEQKFVHQELKEQLKRVKTGH